MIMNYVLCMFFLNKATFHFPISFIFITKSLNIRQFQKCIEEEKRNNLNLSDGFWGKKYKRCKT